MKPKLSESPQEWQKFVLVLVVLLAAVGVWLRMRAAVHPPALSGLLLLLALVLFACWRRPRWFRGIYRVGMTISFHIGQVMGRILLGVFFLVAVCPMGLLLRLMGKDLLKLKRNPAASTYWHPARTKEQFDRMF